MLAAIKKMFCDLCKTMRINRTVAMIGLAAGAAAIAGSLYAQKQLKPLDKEPSEAETKSMNKQKLTLKIVLGVGAAVAAFMAICLLLCKQ